MAFPSPSREVMTLDGRCIPGVKQAFHGFEYLHVLRAQIAQALAQAGDDVIAVQDRQGLVYSRARRNTPAPFEPSIISAGIGDLDVVDDNVVDRRFAGAVAQVVADRILRGRRGRREARRNATALT